MRHASFLNHEALPRPSKRWAIVLIGLPITTLLLLATQSDLRDRIDLFSSQAFSKLEAPYRYPYSDSLSSASRPTARIEQEIAFYQEQTRANSKSGLDYGSLAIAYLRMARATGQGNWYLLAEQSAQQSLAILPVDNKEAIAVLARIAEARHDFRDALKLVNQISGDKEAIGVQATSNLAMGKLNEAAEASEQLVDLTLSMSAFTTQALVETAQGKDKQALQSFQNALKVEEAGELSNSARTRTLLGRFYYERGQLELARNLYYEALHILPQYPMALLNLAQLDIREGRYSSAERQYAQISLAAEGNSTIYDPLILRGRARIKALKGDRAGAEALWAEAETLLRQSFVGNPAGSFGHRRDLARLLLERGNSQDIAEAVSLMDAEIKLRWDAETLDTYAWALAQAGRWQEADKAIKEAIASGINSAGIFYRAGTIAQALGNTSQAQTYLQKAQQVDPQFNEKARQALSLSAGLGS